MDDALRSTAEAIESVRAAAGQIAVSHTTFLEWMNHPGWPFQLRGPWSPAVLQAVKRWADEERPTYGQRRGVAELVGPPGKVRIDWLDVAGDAGPWAARPWMGAVLFDQLTVADFRRLADQLNFALADAQLAVALAEGQPGLAVEARPAYFVRLLRKVEERELERRVSEAALGWMGGRFEGRQWWRELETPIEKPGGAR